jgi:alpha-L-fucosidase
MDPRQLNGPPHDKDDPCPEFVEQFMLRVQDVIDQYNPDLLYFDDNCDWSFDRGGGAVWLGMPELTPHIMAYYYNANMRRNGGKLDAVFNIKNVPKAILSTLVRDFEMSQSDVLEPNPWQTDACIGGWHYQRSLLENHRYKTPQQMVHLLVNVVAKNGNLLLNIPLPGHGRPDADEFAFLEKFGAWMALNGEAIYSTRPWKIPGEGPTQSASTPYGASPQFAPGDIRFTTKGDSLYAIALAWPQDRKLTVKSLASGSPNYQGEVAKVGLLGGEPNLTWSRNADGVTINLPEKPPGDYAHVLKINPLGA